MISVANFVSGFAICAMLGNSPNTPMLVKLSKTVKPQTGPVRTTAVQMICLR